MGDAVASMWGPMVGAARVRSLVQVTMSVLIRSFFCILTPTRGGKGHEISHYMTGRVGPRRATGLQVVVVCGCGTNCGKIEQAFHSKKLEVEGSGELGGSRHQGGYIDFAILLS